MSQSFSARIDGRQIRCLIGTDRALTAPMFCFSLMAPPAVVSGGTLVRRVAGYAEVALPAGDRESQRRVQDEDEFVYILDGEVTLVTDAGEQKLTAGMSAGFPANCADGHHLINRSGRMAIYLEVGDRNDDDKVDYPDIDMKLEMRDGEYAFLHKNGKPYPTE